MTQKWQADSLLSTHSQNTDRYKRNFLKQAVCEFRFPTLMELGEARPPVSFVSALRKEYPHLELANEVTIGVGGSPGSNNTHLLRSSKLTWTVSLKQNALLLETTSYSGFPNMKERIQRVVEAGLKVIDSDFFTRVGLRYVNVIDCCADPIDGWVNSDLVKPLLSKNFLGVGEYAGKIQLTAEDGGCLLQHGIRLKQPQQEGKPSVPEYVLDIDTFRNNVSASEYVSVLDKMHSQAFDLFDWAIDNKARDYLTGGKS